MIEVINQPKPDSKKYQNLLSEIEDGLIKIPRFQRDLVWDIKKTADLLDSILKGYPIGTFIIWKTRERLSNVKKLGGLDLKDTPKGESVQYVLDGQQRLSSLFLAIKGLTITRNNRTIDYKKIFVNLDEPEDSENIVSTEPKGQFISVYDLLNQTFTFFNNYPTEYHEKIENYQIRFKTYDFSTIILNDYTLDDAVDIFSKINTTGTELKLFEIMVARTFDEKSGFDLSEKYDKLKKELEDVSYDIPKAQILQCLSINIKNECTRRVIIKLEKEQIIDVWNDTVESIKATVDHFRQKYRIPISEFLPYPALIVPFNYFFYKKKTSPTLKQDKYLVEYFWKSAFTARFVSGVESKLGPDTDIIDEILDDQKPVLPKDFKVNLDYKDILDLPFRVNESSSRAIMCILAFLQPKSFDSNSTVLLDRSNLLKGNGRNYHHFFPKAFLKKQNKYDKRNLIANITLIDADLNTKKIRDKPPSKYMEEFQKNNPELEETMKTHLIDDLNDYGIWGDDYETFLKKRSERIWKEIQKRINPDV